MAGVKFLGCIGAYFLALVTDKFQLAEGSATEEDLRQLEDNNSWVVLSTNGDLDTFAAVKFNELSILDFHPNKCLKYFVVACLLILSGTVHIINTEIE